MHRSPGRQQTYGNPDKTNIAVRSAPSRQPVASSPGLRVLTGFARAIGTGLTRPSWLSMLTCGAVVGALGLFALSVNEQFVGRHFSPFIPLDSLDYFPAASFDAVRMESSADPRPALVIMGASATNESVLETPELEEALRAAGLDMQVFRLTTSRQNLWESQALAAKLPRDRPAVFVLGIGPSRFTWTKQQLQRTVWFPNLGFRSEVIDDNARAAGLSPQRRTGFYVLDNRNFFLPRAVKAAGRYLTNRPVEIIRFRYDTSRVGPQEETVWQQRGDLIMQRMNDYEQKYAFNVEFLRGFVKDIESNPAWDFALVEHPLNPRFIDEFLGQENYDRFRQHMESFAAGQDIPFWRPYVEAGLTPADYHDWAHVNSDAARQKTTQRLIAHLEQGLGGAK